ncbi:hypothetical protein H9654_00600 [Stenotrophomonas sp. Sa5BUN4]|uniref:Uncharacterized protein n=1 Tax=Stenotrophomonas lacuserhaii TaxID=2760084 RepID=A0A8X8FTM6_9GAMM|nr:hypothetical protein [Stenotrophomonas pennii]MBD7952692.1 hypothetical protein [Stenotrophomonas pennii]
MSLEKIDTSTTAGKVRVMQAYLDGATIKYRGHGRPRSLLRGTFTRDDPGQPLWSWSDIDYSVVQEVAE